MNFIILLGNLTKDVELKKTANSTAVAKFIVAVPRNDKNKTTDFLQCTAFGKNAENISKFFKKGNRIAITGTLQNNNYTDSDKRKHYRNSIIVKSFAFCEKSNGYKPSNPNFDPDSLPF